MDYINDQQFQFQQYYASMMAGSPSPESLGSSEESHDSSGASSDASNVDHLYEATARKVSYDADGEEDDDDVDDEVEEESTSSSEDAVAVAPANNVVAGPPKKKRKKVSCVC